MLLDIPLLNFFWRYFAASAASGWAAEEMKSFGNLFQRNQWDPKPLQRVCIPEKKINSLNTIKFPKFFESSTYRQFYSQIFSSCCDLKVLQHPDLCRKPGFYYPARICPSREESGWKESRTFQFLISKECHHTCRAEITCKGTQCRRNGAGSAPGWNPQALYLIKCWFNVGSWVLSGFARVKWWLRWIFWGCCRECKLTPPSSLEFQPLSGAPFPWNLALGTRRETIPQKS